MIPLDALKALGDVAGGVVTLYNVIQEQKRRRPDNPEHRLEVEAMDAKVREELRALWLYVLPEVEMIGALR